MIRTPGAEDRFAAALAHSGFFILTLLVMREGTIVNRIRIGVQLILLLLTSGIATAAVPSGFTETVLVNGLSTPPRWLSRMMEADESLYASKSSQSQALQVIPQGRLYSQESQQPFFCA